MLHNIGFHEHHIVYFDYISAAMIKKIKFCVKFYSSSEFAPCNDAATEFANATRNGSATESGERSSACCSMEDVEEKQWTSTLRCCGMENGRHHTHTHDGRHHTHTHVYLILPLCLVLPCFRMHCISSLCLCNIHTQ